MFKIAYFSVKFDHNFRVQSGNNCIEILFTYYIIREALVVNVNGRRRLIQGYNAVKEELSISSLQQGAGCFEGVARGSVDVEPDPDGSVPGDLGDDTDCRVSNPPMFSTAIGLNRILLALQAVPTCPTFLA